MGRTTQHLNDRIKQHVPRSILTDIATTDRPKRGRPRKTPAQSTPAQPRPAPKPPPQPTRSSARLKEKRQNTSSDLSQDGDTGHDTPAHVTDLDKNKPDSSIHRHLLSSDECRKCYRDSDFSMLYRARSRTHLEVLEAICIALFKPDLCVQKAPANLSLLHDLSLPK